MEFSHTPQLRKQSLWKRMLRNRWVYAMMIPVIVYFVMFKYIPIANLRIAFYDYKILRGFSGSKYVGLQHFIKFFSSSNFPALLKNTVLFSIGAIFWQTLAPIVFALMINEVRGPKAKKLYQTISFMPYFISVVVVVTMINNIISPSMGLLNTLRKNLGLETVYYLGNPQYFYTINYVSGVWSCMGWNSVVYIAALAGVDEEIYEAAVVDGASRMQRLLHITIPAILPTIAMLLTISVGGLLGGGSLDKLILLQNDMNYSASEMLNTYVYKVGLVNAKYSYASAIGLAMSIVSCTLVIITNLISKKISDSQVSVF
mgnify:FL=1